jgi:hypothetical protein
MDKVHQSSKQTLHHYLIRFSRKLDPDEWWQLMEAFARSMKRHGVVIDDFIRSREEDLAWLHRHGGIDYCEGFVLFTEVDLEGLIKEFFPAHKIQVETILID